MTEYVLAVEENDFSDQHLETLRQYIGQKVTLETLIEIQLPLVPTKIIGNKYYVTHAYEY